MSNSHHHFSENYRPKDEKFFGKIWEFLDQKWRIVVSFLVRKILLWIVKPIVSCLGPKIEMFLNLVSWNGNIFMLLINYYLRDKVINYGKDSKEFISAVGHLDKRTELDKSIKPDNPKYFSALAMMASKIAYENCAFVTDVVQNKWKMELIKHYDFGNDIKKNTTQATMIHDKNSNNDTIIVAFRGTEPFDVDTWCTDLDISWFNEIQDKGKIHGGFMKALGFVNGVNIYEQKPSVYCTIREKLKEILEQNDRTKFIVTGHSLGGALAILFAAALAIYEETDLLKRLEGVYTFGQPRVGNEEFKKFMENQICKFGFKYLRFVYGNDIVPRVPADNLGLMYKHFGTCIYYDSCYIAQIREEVPHKNTVPLLGLGIRQRATAMWEFLRGFTMPYICGSDYAEGWFLKIFRIIGIIFIIPGISAHGPQDYVNITRLESESFYDELDRLTKSKVKCV